MRFGFWGLALMLLCGTGTVRADAPVWRSPANLKVTVLKESRARFTRTSDDGDISLHGDEVALIAVRRGGWLRVRGEVAAIGLAYGDTEGTASVVWDEDASKARLLRVPSFSQARWVAVRGVGHVQIETTASLDNPMARQRFREAMERWLTARGPAPIPQTEGETRALRLAKDAHGIFGQGRGDVRAWIWGQYAELRSEEAHLTSPWFNRAGASASVVPEPNPRHARAKEVDGNRARIEEGQTLWLRADDEDVLTLSLRGTTSQASSASVRVGGRVVRQLAWSGRDRVSSDGWSSRPRVVRVPMGEASKVSVHVSQGRVSVVWMAHAPAKTLYDWVDGDPAFGNDKGTAATLALALRLGAPGAVSKARAFVDGGQGTVLARAFVASELARLGDDAAMRRTYAVAALRDGLLPDALRARLAETLLDAGISLPPSACPRTVDSRDPESLAGYAVLRVLCGASQGKPVATMMVESIAEAFPSNERWSALARQLLVSESQWRDARPTTRTDVKETYSPVDDGAVDGKCGATGQYGVRWSVVGPGNHMWPLAAPARVDVRALRIADAWEGKVRFDDVDVTVHGAAGLTSSAGLLAGDHVISVPKEAPPLLIRWPREGRIACDELRDRAVLVPFEGKLAFGLPQDGTASMARVSLLAREGQKLPTHVDVRIDDVTLRVALFSRGVAEFEVPVASSSRTLTIVSGDASAFARLRVLARGSADAGAAAVQVLPKHEPAEWLAEVERISAALPTALPADRPTLWMDRARALFALGFRWYAFRDWTSAGGTETDFESLRLPSFSQTDVDNVGKVAPVVEGGAVSADDASLLRQLRHWIEQGLTENALGRLGALRAEDAARVSPVTARILALIEADTAERVGDTPRAAAAWERVGDPHGDMEAARLWALVAREGRDVTAWRRSLALAARSQLTDAAAVRLMQRAEDRVIWVRATASASSAGSTVIAEATARDAAPDATTRVRAALLRAPEDAFMLYEGEFLGLRTKLRTERMVRFDGHCEAELGDEACGFVARIDGEVVAQGVDHLDIAVPAGPHQLEIEPSIKALAWLRPVSGLDSTKPMPARRWFVSDPVHPVRFVAMGPSAARVDVRATGTASLEVLLDGQPWRTVPVADGGAQIFVPILGERPVELAVRVAEGQALVRAAFAGDPKFAPMDAPGPRPSVAAAAEDMVDPPVYDGPAGDVAAAREPWPFSFGVTARVVGAEFRDLDVGADGAPYVEWNPEIARAFGDGAVYTGLGAFARIRNGGSTMGGRFRLETPDNGLWPRISLRGQFATQDLDAWYSGYALRAFALWRVPVMPVFSLYPLVGARFAHVASVPAGALNVDPDVYNFADDVQPWSVFGEVVGYIRPLVDLASRVRGRVVAVTDSAKVDRVEFGASVDAVPGAGLTPWVSLSYLASFRFETRARDRAYLRHIVGGSLLFWRWGDAQNRLALGLEGRLIPSEKIGECSLTLSYWGARHRGVMDLSRAEVEHRDRMNEGADVAEELGRSSWGVPGRIDGD